jgi:hypothetical protein
VTITEPVTMATDYVLALAALGCAVSLRRSRRSVVSIVLWRLGFLFTAAAAAVGGTYHGFAPYFSASVHETLWRVTVALIAAGATVVAAAVFSGPLGRERPSTRWLIAGGLLQSQRPGPLRADGGPVRAVQRSAARRLKPSRLLLDGPSAFVTS